MAMIFKKEGVVAVSFQRRHLNKCLLNKGEMEGVIEALKIIKLFNLSIP